MHHPASSILHKGSQHLARNAEAVCRCIITQSISGRVVRTASSYSRIGTSLSRNSNKFLRPASSMSSGNNSKQQSKAQHSTASATELIQSSSAGDQKSSAALLTKTKVPRPSFTSLRTLFTASAIPMVGFGFMDNLVMIQAGQYIDSTLGVSLGLATMTAAAAGQVVSDVSGVVFGGTLERFLMRFSLISSPALTAEQRQLPISRNVAMAGAVVGVIFGCALGATTLLLVDLEARERVERAIRLKEIVHDMIEEEISNNSESSDSSNSIFKTCTVYIAAANDFTISKTDPNSVVKMKLLRDTKTNSAHQCALTKQAIISESNETLYVPVVKQKKGEDDEVMAVLAFHSGKIEHNALKDEDVLTAKVMARHIAIFMDRLVEM